MVIFHYLRVFLWKRILWSQNITVPDKTLTERESFTKNGLEGIKTERNDSNITIGKSGPVLESKGICAIFQKKCKIYENLANNVQNLKIFWKKGSLICATIACMKMLEYALQLSYQHNGNY